MTYPKTHAIQDTGSIDPRSRIPALDGLRGCAILLVISWHYFHSRLFPGWAGVDLFFVLSGYLITGRLLRTIDDPHYFSRFYRNRILRTLPLYYALIIVFLGAILLFVQPQHLQQFDFYLRHWKSMFLFTTNWTVIRFGTPKDYSLLPVWSIAVEEQFYLLWPLFILATRRRPKFRIGLLISLITLILLTRTATWLYYPSLRQTCYYNTFFRLDCLFAGSLLCLFDSSGIRFPTTLVNRVAFPVLAILVLGIILLGDATPENGFYSTAGFTLNALLFTIVLYLALHPGSPQLTRFLSLPALRFFGRISYCLYLIHVPILLNIGPRLVKLAPAAYLAHPDFIRLTAAGICLALAILISTLSYRYFESFFLRLKK